MIVSPSLVKEYPKIAAWICDTLPEVRKNPKVFKAFQKYAGFDEKVAERAIKDGNPPSIEWRHMPADNGQFLTKYPDTVFIAMAICARFEKDHADSRMHLLVESTLLHEMVHWGDYADGTVDTSQELGTAFERQAYGKDVGRYW